jgi:hypothetical protein
MYQISGVEVPLNWCPLPNSVTDDIGFAKTRSVVTAISQSSHKPRRHYARAYYVSYITVQRKI